MLALLLSWAILAFAVWLTATVLPGVHVRKPSDTIIVAALIGILNFLFGWFFFAVFAIATLGIALVLAFITRWIINAIILIIADSLTDRLTIDNFRWALLAALMMSAIGTVGEWIVRQMLS